MNLLTAPFYALFSTAFYRNVQKSRVGRGMLYMLYLSVITTLLMIFVSVTRFLPVANSFIDWVKQDMPKLTWTSGGMVMDARSPYLMVHPELGPLITFDTTVEEVTTEDMGDTMMYITSKKLYVRQGINQIRVYDLLQAAAQAEARGQEVPQAINITPDLIQQFYDSLKPWILSLGALFFLLFLYLWKLLIAFLYSWIGLLINMMRQSKLEFGQIYTTTLFVMTVPLVIQWIRLVVPFVGRLPFGILGSLLVTIGYLFFAVKIAEEKVSPAPPVQ